jgi:hypothetical protein
MPWTVSITEIDGKNNQNFIGQQKKMGDVPVTGVA